MFEWLSVPARQVIVDAHEVASAAGRPAVGAGDVVVGLLHTGTAVAGDVLRARVDMEVAVDTIRALPETEADHGDVLQMVMAGAVAVAADRGTSQVGTASLLVALLALDPPGLALLFEAVGADAAEVLTAARSADDSTEPERAIGDGDWVVTLGGTDPDVAWDDRRTN